MFLGKLFWNQRQARLPNPAYGPEPRSEPSPPPCHSGSSRPAVPVATVGLIGRGGFMGPIGFTVFIGLITKASRVYKPKNLNLEPSRPKTPRTL